MDHFLLSEQLAGHVVSAGVIHRGDNVSGHAPIFLKLVTADLPRKVLSEMKKLPKQNWKAATEKDNLIMMS